MRDVLLHGGRVIDPGTGTDQVADVLVRDGSVAAIGQGLPAPDDAVLLDVAGLVVGPGFVDLHSHVNSITGQRLQAMDGVTTALELEAGATPVGSPTPDRGRGGRPLNYGFSASWALARGQVLVGLAPDASIEATLGLFGEQSWLRDSSPAELTAWLGLLETRPRGRRAGHRRAARLRAVHRPDEYLAVARLAAKAGAPTYTHAREIVEADPTTPIDGAEETRARRGRDRRGHAPLSREPTSRRHVDRVLATAGFGAVGGQSGDGRGVPVRRGQHRDRRVLPRPGAAGRVGPAARQHRRWWRPGSGSRTRTGCANCAPTDPAAACIIEFFDERDRPIERC